MHETPEAWYAEGHKLILEGKYQEALQAFDQALHLKLDYSQAHLGRSVCLKMLGQAEESDKALALAQALNPGAAENNESPPASQPEQPQTVQQKPPLQPKASAQAKPLGMRWYNAVTYGILPFSILANLATALPDPDYPGSMKLMVCIVVVIIGCIIFGLHNRQKWASTGLLCMWAAQTGMAPFILLDKEEETQRIVIVLAVVLAFYVLNFLYFRKRRHLMS